MAYELWFYKTIINDNKNHHKVFMNHDMRHSGEAQNMVTDDNVQGSVWRIGWKCEREIKICDI